MADGLSMTFDMKNTDVMLTRLHKTVKNPQPILKKFHTYMLRRTGLTFRELRHGGSFRGVYWKPFAASSIGRLRPSGRRITTSSNLLRDTGRLAAEAGTTQNWQDGGRTLLMTTRDVSYGAEQQAMRKFLFFEIPVDNEAGARIAKEEIERPAGWIARSSTGL